MADFYKILVVGQSGKGKTFAARNMDPNRTGYVNAEDKPLPFKNNFKHHQRCTTIGEVKKALKKFAEDDSINAIVFDSFSAFTEMLLFVARDEKRGYEIWNYYNEEIGKLLKYIKSIQKEVIVIAHYEMLNIEGDPEKRVKVKGKEWEGMIEKEFTMVLYADRKIDENGEINAWFSTSLDGSSAKCPPDIFGPKQTKIPNDYKRVIEATVKFARH